MSNAGRVEKPMDIDDTEQAVEASSSMISGDNSSNTGNRGNAGSHQGGSTNAGMKNTTHQSTGGEQSSTGGGSSSGGTGVGSTSGPHGESNKGNTIYS